MSKGSKPRPRQVSFDEYAENWDKVFSVLPADCYSENCGEDHCPCWEDGGKCCGCGQQRCAE